MDDKVTQVVVGTPINGWYTIHYSRLAQLNIKGGAEGIGKGIIAIISTRKSAIKGSLFEKHYKIIGVREDLIHRSIEVTLSCKGVAAEALQTF